MSKHRKFCKVWYGINDRCNNEENKSYYRYGGRGIKNKWVSFEQFRKDMWESFIKHISINGIKNTSLDRTDNDGNYCKENCKWATYKQQARNTKRNRLYTFNTESLILEDWSKKLGIKRLTLFNRVNYLNWSINKAFTTPTRKHQIYKNAKNR